MRKFLFVLSIALVVFGAFGCSKNDGEEAKESKGAAKESSGKMKIGLSFSDFATERWTEERDKMTRMLEDKGYEVIAQGANHDPRNTE